MSRTIFLLRMALGGAICGCFLGILGGAALGALYGWYRDDISLGLDGALFGGGLLALGGAVYGTVLGLTEGPARPQPGAVIMARESRPPAPDAGRELTPAHGAEWLLVPENRHLGL